MIFRLPQELQKLKKSTVSLNEVLRYYDESSNRNLKIQAKKIWINKRKNMRKKAQLSKENQSELEEAFNRNLKRLKLKKEQLKKEEEFNKKKRQITKQYEQKQRDDLNPGKGIRYRQSKVWKNRNNKTRKSPLSREHHQSTNALTPTERKRLTQLSLQQMGQTAMEKESESEYEDSAVIGGKRKKRKTKKRKRSQKLHSVFLGGVKHATRKSKRLQEKNQKSSKIKKKPYFKNDEDKKLMEMGLRNWYYKQLEKKRQKDLEFPSNIFDTPENSPSKPTSNTDQAIRRYAELEIPEDIDDEEYTPSAFKKLDFDNVKGGKTRRRKRKKKKGKTQRRRRSRKRRKTRRKRAGKSTFIAQSKINKGIEGCNTLHRMSEVHKCRNMGGLEKYNKKKLIGKIHLPHLNRPHLPHFTTKTEKHNKKLAEEDWGDLGFGK